MNQSRLESLVEQLLNVLSGFLISALIIQPIIFPIFGVHTTVSENLLLAAIFTAVSIIRGYYWRRLFNDGSLKRFIHNFIIKIRS